MSARIRNRRSDAGPAVCHPPQPDDLRLTFPRAVVERLEKLERRLEKLEAFAPLPVVPLSLPIHRSVLPGNLNVPHDSRNGSRRHPGSPISITATWPVYWLVPGNAKAKFGRHKSRRGRRPNSNAQWLTSVGIQA